MNEIMRMTLVQYGFAGFCALLLLLLTWLVRQLIGLLRDNQKVIAENTSAFTLLFEKQDQHLALTRELLGLLRSISDRMLKKE